MKLVKEGQSDHDRALVEAYEFVLSNVGVDIDSGKLWTAYINFLTQLPTKDQLQKNKKNQEIRDVYKRALVTPIHEMEELFRQYDKFEHDYSSALAVNLLREFQPKYLDAKKTYLERKRKKTGILNQLLATPPGDAIHEQNRSYQQVLLWKAYTDYERSNPQRLEPADLKKRVTYAMKQALLFLRHFPEVWADYADFMQEIGSAEDAEEIYKEAREAIPYSLLMAILHAEFEEKRGNIDETRAIYKSICEGLPAPGAPAGSKLVQHPMAHIAHIRFALRTEGIKAARRVFAGSMKKAKSHQLCAAAALIEFHVNDDKKVAGKIFEVAFKQFSDELQLVDLYLDYLWMVRDHNNMRVVFEKVLNSSEYKENAELWERFVNFERQVGDLDAILKAEARRNEALGLERPPIYDVIERNRFLDVSITSQQHQDVLKRNFENMSSSSGLRSAADDAKPDFSQMICKFSSCVCVCVVFSFL